MQPSVAELHGQAALSRPLMPRYGTLLMQPAHLENQPNTALGHQSLGFLSILDFLMPVQVQGLAKAKPQGWINFPQPLHWNVQPIMTATLESGELTKYLVVVRGAQR